MIRRTAIRLDRRLDLEWLDAVAAQVAAGHDLPTTHERLFTLLKDRISGGRTYDSACQKTIRVLLQSWLKVPDELVPFRDRAVNILPSLTMEKRVGVHWAMLLAGYRFFGDVAESTGRLLELQGNVTLSQLTRRMRETWGDRSTLDRATQRVARSMVEWGALIDTRVRGAYSRPQRTIPVCGTLSMLLIEALLLHSGSALPIEQVIRHPALFPFAMDIHAAQLRQSPRLDVHRQGLDMEVIGLRDSV